MKILISFLILLTHSAALASEFQKSREAFSKGNPWSEKTLIENRFLECSRGKDNQETTSTIRIIKTENTYINTGSSPIDAFVLEKNLIKGVVYEYPMTEFYFPRSIGSGVHIIEYATTKHSQHFSRNKSDDSRESISAPHLIARDYLICSSSSKFPKSK